MPVHTRNYVVAFDFHPVHPLILHILILTVVAFAFTGFQHACRFTRAFDVSTV